VVLEQDDTLKPIDNLGNPAKMFLENHLHETYIHLVVGAFAEKNVFPVTSFFRCTPVKQNQLTDALDVVSLTNWLTWSAQQHNTAVDCELFHNSFDCTCDGDSCNGDQVVSTCVSNSWQRIHFWVNPDYSAAFSICKCGDPGSLKMVVRGHGESVRGHEGSQDIVGMTESWNINAIREILLTTSRTFPQTWARDDLRGSKSVQYFVISIYTAALTVDVQAECAQFIAQRIDTRLDGIQKFWLVNIRSSFLLDELRELINIIAVIEAPHLSVSSRHCEFRDWTRSLLWFTASISTASS
jgi:hypothetical protein